MRAAAPDTLIVADGFSCQTQIEQAGTGRSALHIAEVMQLAREFGADGPPDRLPELHGGRRQRPQPSAFARLGRLGVPAIVAGGAVAMARRRRR